MDSKTYLKESARTASSQFNTSIVDPAMLHHALKEAIKTGELVDVAKKSLFYGKPIKEGTGIEAHKGAESSINPNAVSSDIVHAVLGLFTEASEMVEAVLAAMEGGELDEVNMLEEMGDAEWYMAMNYRAINRLPSDAKGINIAKLTKRFPNAFSSEDAIDRDTVAERVILEEGHKSK